MKEVNSDEWGSHCCEFRTVGSEQRFSGGESWLSLHISPEAPNRPWQKVGTPGALVGRVVYRPDGTQSYFIY